MAQAAKSQEPSMEEILASIRRIIAEDDSEKSAQRPAKAASVELNPDAGAALPEVERAAGEPYSPPLPDAAGIDALSGTVNAARSSTVLDLTEPMVSSASRSAAAPTVDSSLPPAPPAPIDRAL